MDVTDIGTTDWQMSVTGFGEVAQGSDDVNQCLNVILATQKGSDPLRFDFGIDLLRFIDQPVNTMAPALVQQIITQIAAYETRINLSTVNYSTPLDGGVLFTLTWSYKQGTVLNGKNINGNETTYFLLADQNGFVLLTDFDVALIVN